MNKIKILDFEIEYKVDGEKLTYFKFLNTDQLEKDDIKILTNFEKICLSLKVQELYEHGIIRLENSYRNFDKIEYQGIFFAENHNEIFKKLKELLRTFINQIFELDFKKKNNFQSITKDTKWKNIPENKKKEIIEKSIIGFINSKFHHIKVDLTDFINDEEIYLNFTNEVSIHEKEEFLLSLEIFLKENVSNHLLIYMSPMIDKNKGRRLTL
tara:strand:+ start:181 stop:816 length:636 start_codon:yes stop_codon:yes gene_type:complete